MDELPLEELDGFEKEEMVEEESVFVTDAGDDAFMSVVASLRSVLIRIGAQQLQHQLRRAIAVGKEIEDISSK